MNFSKQVGALGVASAAAALALSFVVGAAGAEPDAQRAGWTGPRQLTYQRAAAGANVGQVVIPSLPATSEENGTYHSLTPCRLVDTSLAGGLMTANSTRSFLAFGELDGQGGSAAGCGIPETATALVLNVTAKGPQGNGNLRAWAYGDDQPSVSLVNFVKGVNIANAATVGICRDLTDYIGRCAPFDFSVRAAFATTHVVVDVMGYYEGPLMVRVFPDGSVLAASRSVVEVYRFENVGQYEVVFDRDVSSCIATATHDAHSIFGDYSAHMVTSLPSLDPSGMYIGTYDGTGTPENASFSLVVTC